MPNVALRQEDETGPAGRFREVPTGGRAAPLHTRVGVRYGELKVEALLGQHITRGNRWLCRCDCGGMAIRYTSSLNRAARNGSVQSCRECAEQLRRGRKAANTFWVEFFREHGTAWPASSCASLERRIAEDLEVGGHRGPQEAVESFSADVDRWCPPDNYRNVQRIAELYPISGTSRRCKDAEVSQVWECCECRTLVPRGFACLERECDEFVCIECVRQEKHKHHDRLDRTLEELAGYMSAWVHFPITREGIRQLEAKALRKLRRPSRSRQLRPLVDSGMPERAQPLQLMDACILGELKEGQPPGAVARKYCVATEYVRSLQDDAWWKEKQARERLIQAQPVGAPSASQHIRDMLIRFASSK